MRDTFVAVLIESVETFDQPIRERDAGKGGQTAARASMHAALASGTAAVQKIDAMVTNHLRGDPETTALWRTVRRIGHARRPRRVAAAPAPALRARTGATGGDPSAGRGAASDDVVVSHGERVMTRRDDVHVTANRERTRDTEH